MKLNNTKIISIKLILKWNQIGPTTKIKEFNNIVDIPGRFSVE